jgi:glycosyltransferase involved in cell wall biosynthesis
MSAAAILVHEGLAEPGGVTTDVRNIADALGLPAVSTVRALRGELSVHPRAAVHVFGCLPSATTFGAMGVARTSRRRLVWTPIFNPIRPRTWVGYGLRRPPMEVFDRVAPRAARFATAVIAATDAEATFFSRWTRAEVIPPGVEDRPPAAVDDVASFRRRLGLNGPTILVVARDNSRKALPFGMSAFHALRRTIPEAQLLLVGPDLDHRYGALDGVVLAGWLHASEVDVAYAAADVLFVSSLYEGLPRSVIEAWRAGLATVVTDRVALAPLVAGGAGRVVPYGDVDAASHALAGLLRDAAERARCGRHGREIVDERFLLSRVVSATARLYAEVARS